MVLKPRQVSFYLFIFTIEALASIIISNSKFTIPKFLRPRRREKEMLNSTYVLKTS